MKKEKEKKKMQSCKARRHDSRTRSLGGCSSELSHCSECLTPRVCISCLAAFGGTWYIPGYVHIVRTTGDVFLRATALTITGDRS